MKHIKTFATERGYVGTIYQDESGLYYGVIINPIDITLGVPQDEIDELDDQMERYMGTIGNSLSFLTYLS